jgi:hypothetical protein
VMVTVGKQNQHLVTFLAPGCREQGAQHHRFCSLLGAESVPRRNTQNIIPRVNSSRRRDSFPWPETQFPLRGTASEDFCPGMPEGL